MNARERVLKALNHEEPDKVPSFELSIDNLSICKNFNEEYVFQGMVKSFNDLYSGDAEQFTKTILMATQSRSYIKTLLKKHIGLYNKVGVDMALIPYTGYILFPQHCEKDHFVDEYGRIFNVVKNPSDGMDIAYYKEGKFKDYEDFEEFPPLKPYTPRREKYFKAMKKAEKDSEGKICIIPGIWTVFESVWQSFGFVNFSKLLTKHREIKKVFDDRGKFIVELVKLIIDWGEDTGIFLFADYGYKKGLLVRPQMFQTYILPWVKEICRIAHKAGLKILFHSCGEIYKLFDDIVNTGIDAIHPIEPTTSNPDYNIFKLHEKYGDKITFMGNVSPQDLAYKNSEYIQEYTKKLIKELAPGGGYILSSGHSINPSVKLENYLAMHNTLKKYGKYPISIP